jgi:hypothetical protein
MKFDRGAGWTNIRQLNLRLNSIDVKFNCHMREGYDPANDDNELGNNERWASIEFRDSREVDELIRILERFRDESSAYIGVWR